MQVPVFDIWNEDDTLYNHKFSHISCPWVLATNYFGIILAALGGFPTHLALIPTFSKNYLFPDLYTSRSDVKGVVSSSTLLFFPIMVILQSTFFCSAVIIFLFICILVELLFRAACSLLSIL